MKWMSYIIIGFCLFFYLFGAHAAEKMNRYAMQNNASFHQDLFDDNFLQKGALIEVEATIEWIEPKKNLKFQLSTPLSSLGTSTITTKKSLKECVHVNVEDFLVVRLVRMLFGIF